MVLNVRSFGAFPDSMAQLRLISPGTGPCDAKTHKKRSAFGIIMLKHSYALFAAETPGRPVNYLRTFLHTR